MCIYIYMYMYIYIYMYDAAFLACPEPRGPRPPGRRPAVPPLRRGPRKGGSAPKGGAHSTVCFACTASETLESCFLQIICSCFGNPPQNWSLGAGLLGAPPFSLAELSVVPPCFEEDEDFKIRAGPGPGPTW